MEENGYAYENIKQIADFLLERTKHRPKIGIVCGSGLSGLADWLDERHAFPYEEIPDFPISTVSGHPGRLVFGLLNGIPMVCMQGRFHNYEGYTLWKCAMPIRVMKLVGVETVILTNAAGGISSDYACGDIMIIKDHINLPGFAGDSPLRGRNDERWGPRFPSMSNLFDTELRKLAKTVAENLELSHVFREGIYVMVGGPSYETIAELRLLKLVGADAVGMSTVHEAITARHCGLRVFAMSLITNKCILEYDTGEEANHEEVLATANHRKEDLQKFVTEFVKEINNLRS
ncbi:hypothetical protein CHUAL_007055 [Chamberlinius hualienensis]